MLTSLKFTPEAQPFACWFIGGFIMLFGAGFVVVGFDEMSGSLVLGALQVLFGGVILFYGWRAFFYYRRASFELSTDAIILRPFWTRTKRHYYSAITEFGVYEQSNKVKSYLQSPTGRVVASQHLELSMNNGKTVSLTMPRFDNSHLLQELERRTGKSRKILPPQTAG